MTNKIGKRHAINNPVLKFPRMLEICPTIVGPTAQPISPAKANRANMAVPPPGQVFEARENVPGHIIPTLKPHRLQPSRERIGFTGETARR